MNTKGKLQTKVSQDLVWKHGYIAFVFSFLQNFSESKTMNHAISLAQPKQN